MCAGSTHVRNILDQLLNVDVEEREYYHRCTRPRTAYFGILAQSGYKHRSSQVR